jgi:hypothetical protein
MFHNYVLAVLVDEYRLNRLVELTSLSRRDSVDFENHNISSLPAVNLTDSLPPQANVGSIVSLAMPCWGRIGSIQWTYIPGTAENAQGQPIDGNGNVIANNNSATSGPVGVSTTIPPLGSGSTITRNPGNSGTVSVTIECGRSGNVGCPQLGGNLDQAERIATMIGTAIDSKKLESNVIVSIQ